MKLCEVIKIIESEYPPKLSYQWDNPGLFYGDLNKEINTVTLTLDITYDVVKQAVANKSDMILSHHPFTMSGLKTLADDSMHSDMVREIIKNDICIYSAHTNMDVSENGINQKLAELFELSEVEILEKNPDFENCGLGRVGLLPNKVNLYDFCETVKEKLNTPFVRVCGDNREIRKIAVASGSCSEYVPYAISMGADVIITADMKYHHCIDYVYDGIAIIDAGHFPTEIIVQTMFSDILKNTGINVVFAEINDIFKVI